MSDCSYHADGVCTLATSLVGESVVTTPDHCQYCSLHAMPPRALNPVVVSLALHTVRTDRPKAQRLLDCHGHVLRVHHNGPGTELKKLLSWWFRPDDSCECDARAMQMNAWGVEGCRERLETIVQWLLEAAAERGLPHGPLSRQVTRRLVRLAINNAEHNAL